MLNNWYAMTSTICHSDNREPEISSLLETAPCIQLRNIRRSEGKGEPSILRNQRSLWRQWRLLDASPPEWENQL